MKKINLILITIICLAVNCEITAQRKKSKKKEPVEKSTVIVFDDEEEKGQKEETKSLLLNIKTSPLSFIFGYQLLEAEKEITDYLSLQAGVGVTFKDRIKSTEIYSELFEEENLYSAPSPNWYQDVGDSYSFGRQNKMGYCFSFSPRLFYESDGFEGAYIAPAFTYKRYNYLAQDIVNGQANGNYVDAENLITKDITVRFGYNYLYEKIMTESFIGIGTRSNSSRRQDIGFDVNGKFGKAFQDFSNSELRLEAGIRIGFQF